MVPNQEAGRYPFDFLINDGAGLGRAAVDPALLQYTLNGTVVAITVHPHVSDISLVVSGSLGGALLTITGSGFAVNSDTNVVQVAGSPCEVQSVTASQIKCIVGPAPAVPLPGPVFSGSRGLLLEVCELFSLLLLSWCVRCGWSWD